MFDGVGWAAGEIVVFILIATLIGFAVGWIFGRWLQKNTIAESYEGEIVAQRELARKAEARLGESNKNLDKVHLDLKGEQAKVADLTVEVEVPRSAATDLEGTDDVAEQRDADIERLTAELATKGEVAEQKDADIERLTAELATKGDLEARLSAAGNLDAELSTLRDDLAASGTERDGLTGRVADLEGDVASRDERIARLESELEVTAEPIVEPVPVVEPVHVEEPAAVEKIAAEPTKEEGLAKIVEIAERTAGGGPAANDDLRKVHGIGPKLQRTLKGLGITSFRQIANFQAEDITYFTAALDGFKGRIERDDWMSSAAEQHTKKYNEPA